MTLSSSPPQIPDTLSQKSLDGTMYGAYDFSSGENSRVPSVANSLHSSANPSRSNTGDMAQIAAEVLESADRDNAVDGLVEVLPPLEAHLFGAGAVGGGENLFPSLLLVLAQRQADDVDVVLLDGAQHRVGIDDRVEPVEGRLLHERGQTLLVALDRGEGRRMTGLLAQTVHLRAEVRRGGEAFDIPFEGRVLRFVEVVEIEDE